MRGYFENAVCNFIVRLYLFFDSSARTRFLFFLAFIFFDALLATTTCTW